MKYIAMIIIGVVVVTLGTRYLWHAMPAHIKQKIVLGIIPIMGTTAFAITFVWLLFIA